MGRPDDVAVVLRARNGRNILLQTRGISPNDVKQGSKEVVGSLSKLASGADGNPPAQGYVSVNNGRHNAVHRLVHSVYVIGIAAPSTALFSLVRVVDSVSGQLVAACKGTDVTLDKVAKRYTEIYAGISATLSRNGHLDSATHAAESSAILKLMFPDDKKDKKQRKKSEREAEAAAARASQQGGGGSRQRRTLVDGPKLGTTEVDPELLAVAASFPSPSPSRASSIPQSSPAMSPRKSSAHGESWGFGRPTPEGSSVGGSLRGTSHGNFADTDWDAFDQADSSAPALPQQQQSAAFADDGGFGAFGDFGSTPREQQADGFGAFGDFGPSAQEHQPQTDGFGAFGDFGSSAQEQQPQADGFGAFGDFGSSAQEKQPRTDGFGTFGDFGSAPQEKQPRTDGFGTFGDFGSSAQEQQKDQTDGFGAFGDFGSSAQEQPQQPQAGGFGDFGDFGSTQEQQPQTDGFGAFGDFGSTPQEQQPQQPQADGFGTFGDFGSSSQEQQPPQTDGFGAFGDFGSATQADGFGDFPSAHVAPPPPADSAPTASSSSAAAVPKAAAAFNAFGGGFEAFGDGNFGGGGADVATAAAAPAHVAAAPAEPEGGSFGWGAAAAVAGGAAAVGGAAFAAVRASTGSGADQKDQEAPAPFPGPTAADSAAAASSTAAAASYAPAFFQPPEPEGLVLVEKWEGEFVGGALSSVSVTGEVMGPQHTDTDDAPPPQVRLQGPSAPPASRALSSALAAAREHDQLMGGLLHGATAASGAERAILASYSLPPSAVPPPLVLKVSVASPLDRTATAGAEELVVVQFAVSPKLPAALEELIVHVELGQTGARPPAKASPAAEWCARTGTLQWRLSATDLIPGARGALMAALEAPLQQQQQQSLVAQASFSMRGCTLSGTSCSSSSSAEAPEPTAVKARCTGVVTARIGA